MVCVCVCLVGVMNGRGTCIIDPFLQASCTWTGIKMIHGPFPGLIPLILRYQPAALCGQGVGRGPERRHSAGQEISQVTI